MNDRQAKKIALRRVRHMLGLCPQIVRLRGLEGTGGAVSALVCCNTPDALRALDNGYAVTAAGDLGSFCVWKVGIIYHCELYRYTVVHDRLLTNILPRVVSWMDKHFILISADMFD